MQQTTSPPPVMILGCGRSGTSIFGELFEHLPGYQYASEPPFAEVLTSTNREGMAHACKVPTESAGHPPDPGLSIPLDTLLQKQPDTVLFWIVRHPYDAISSLRPGISNNWGHHPRPPDWQTWQQQPLLARCAHHWAHINTLGYARVKARAKLVYFEDMLAAPRQFVTNVCNVLRLDRQARAEALASWAGRVQNTNNAEFVEAQTSRNYSRPDHQVRVGRWRENLTSTDVHLIRPLVEAASQQFGYDLGAGS